MQSQSLTLSITFHVPLSHRLAIWMHRIRPADTPDYPRDEWFNLFVLHQNRTPHSQVGRCRGMQ